MATRKTKQKTTDDTRDDIQESLDSLRAVRQRLYSYSDAELGSMGLDDQILYADSLYKVGDSIKKLEIAKLKAVNQQFKAKQGELAAASSDLTKRLRKLESAVEAIRVTGQAISLIAKIIALLG